MKRIQQAIGKLFFCLRISNGWSSFYRLVLNSKRFSSYYRRMEESGKMMQLQEQEPPDTTPDLQAVRASTDVQQQPATHLKNGYSEQHVYNEKQGYNQQAITDRIAKNEQPGRYQFKLREKANQTAAVSSREVYLRTYAGDIQMFYDMMLKQSYQVAQLKDAKDLVIVDAGANIGMAALYFMDQYHVAKIFCIEPDAKNVAILMLNLRQELSDGKIILSKKALSAEAGTMTWSSQGWSYNAKLGNLHTADHSQISDHLTTEEYLQKNHKQTKELLQTGEHLQTNEQLQTNKHLHTKDQIHRKNQKQQEEQKQTLHQTRSGPASFVETITIGEFLRENNISHIDLLKIDVEGAEEQIFSGDLSWLAMVSNLIIEIHSEPVTDMIRTKLMNAGFDFGACNNSPYSDIYLAMRHPA